MPTPVYYAGPLSLSLGDPIFFRRAKARELMERLTHMLPIRDGRVADGVSWNCRIPAGGTFFE